MRDAYCEYKVYPSEIGRKPPSHGVKSEKRMIYSRWVYQYMSIFTTTVSLREAKRGGMKKIENKANYKMGNVLWKFYNIKQ